MKIGIIGAGMIADKHIEMIRKDGRACVEMLCDIDLRVLEQKLQTYHIKKGTTDYKDVLDNDQIDAVIIATPPHTHAKLFKEAVKAKKHVLLEKPTATNIKELNEIRNMEKMNSDLVLMDASCRHTRLQPKYHQIKKMIESGILGEIYYVHHQHVMRQKRCGIEHNPSAKWFLDKSKAVGGPLVDWGVYDLSFHFGILGDHIKVKSMNGFTKNGLDQVESGAPIFDVEEHGVVHMVLDNGILYDYERSSNAHNEVANVTRIYGTKGGLTLHYYSWDEPEIIYYTVSDGGKGVAKKEIITADMSQHPGDELALIIHFINCIEGKDIPMMPIALAAKHMEIIFQMLNL